MKSTLYTRKGDRGDTSLVDGTRSPKDSLRLEAYGTIDELSSCIGLMCSYSDLPEEIRGQLNQVQHTLFEIGGYLATPVNEEADTSLSGIGKQTSELEEWIDILDEQTPKIRSFVLPGGSELSSRAHIARTVCRRAERRIVSLAREEFVDPEVATYINRLSDYLFIAARYANFIKGVADIPWKRHNNI